MTNELKSDRIKLNVLWAIHSYGGNSLKRFDVSEKINTDYLEKKIENVIEGKNKKSGGSVVRTKTKKESDKKTQKKKV